MVRYVIFIKDRGKWSRLTKPGIWYNTKREAVQRMKYDRTLIGKFKKLSVRKIK